MTMLSPDQLRWRYRAWRYRLKLEKREVRLIRDYLQPGATAIDIGAHKGAFTWWIRDAVGPSGRVVAFEPQPALASKLKRLAGQRNLDNVTVENLGLSSETAEMILHVPAGGPSPGASFEKPAQGGEQSDRVRVGVTTLDTYIDQHDLHNVRLLKIDVEGHELEVFRGGAALLARDRPVILFECELRHRKSGSLDDVFSFLLDLGYEGFLVTAADLLPVGAFDPKLHQVPGDPKRYFNNFWFRPKR
jgi:FkbM family methyltransferase